MAKFNEILKGLRIARGITQAEFSKAIGVSPSTVGMYETGEREPNFETEERIADYFNVSLDTLRGKEGTEKSVLLSEEQEFISKYRHLDATDKVKVESYTDGLLSQEKYTAPRSSEGVS